MALTINNAIFVPNYANLFYTEAVYKATTIGQGGLSIIPNVVNSIKLPYRTMGSGLQADSCNFSASGDVTLNAKTLSVCTLKINKEFCLADYEGTFLADSMGAGALNKEIPADFTQWLLDKEAVEIANDIDNIIQNGTGIGAGLLSLCKGFLPNFAADANITLVTTPVAITAANIVAELNEMYNTMLPTLIGSTNLRFYLPLEYQRFLVNAMQVAPDQVNMLGVSVMNGAQSFQNIPIIWVPTMPADNMVLAEYTNLFFGTDLISDFNTLKMIDLTETTGDFVWRMISRMKMGLQYGISEEIVWYHV